VTLEKKRKKNLALFGIFNKNIIDLSRESNPKRTLKAPKGKSKKEI
jgi:hypothetical protein